MGAVLSRPADWQYLEGICRDKVHPWRQSCVLNILELTCIVAYEGFKIYLPLYLLSEFLRHCSLFRLVKILPQVLRSSLFLGSNIGFIMIFACSFSRLIGRFYYYLSVLLPAILGTGCALMIERPVRRPLLAGYMATVAIESFFSHLRQRGLAPQVPYGEVLMFSLASAILFHRFRVDPVRGSLVTSMLSGLMHPRLPPVLIRLFQSTPWNNRLTQLFLVGIWAFLIGFFFQFLLSFLNQRTKLKRKSLQIKTLAQCFKFATFLSLLTAGFKLVNSVLYLLPVSRDTRLLLAGLIAGLSMVFYRSSALSLYVAWKALEVLYSQGVDKGWLRYIPYGEVLIYAVSTGWLIHQLVYEPHNMRWAYWHFLRRISWGRMQLFNFSELDKFGTGASTRVKEWKNSTKEQSRQE